MATRLTELLERIRPSGTPGAPAEGDRGPDAAAGAEIADVAALLREFRADASRTTARAIDAADRIGRDADRRIREIRAEIPARRAAAESPAPSAARDLELARIDAAGARSLEELDRRAADGTPPLVDQAVRLIRQIADDVEVAS